jgi:hypothetical protein
VSLYKNFHQLSSNPLTRPCQVTQGLNPKGGSSTSSWEARGHSRSPQLGPDNRVNESRSHTISKAQGRAGREVTQEALNWDLITESVKAEATPSARLREVRAGAAMGTLPPVTKHGGLDDLYVGSVWTSFISEKT